MPPTTWEEMYEYGKKLVEAGVVKHALLRLAGLMFEMPHPSTTWSMPTWATAVRRPPR